MESMSRKRKYTSIIIILGFAYLLLDFSAKAKLLTQLLISPVVLLVGLFIQLSQSDIFNFLNVDNREPWSVVLRTLVFIMLSLVLIEAWRLVKDKNLRWARVISIIALILMAGVVCYFIFLVLALSSSATVIYQWLPILVYTSIGAATLIFVRRYVKSKEIRKNILMTFLISAGHFLMTILVMVQAHRIFMVDFSFREPSTVFETVFLFIHEALLFPILKITLPYRSHWPEGYWGFIVFFINSLIWGVGMFYTYQLIIKYIKKKRVEESGIIL